MAEPLPPDNPYGLSPAAKAVPPDGEPSIPVLLLSPGNQRAERQAWPSEPVAQLKVRLYESPPADWGLVPPPCALSLSFSGVELPNEHSLSQHGVMDGATIEARWDPDAAIQVHASLSQDRPVPDAVPSPAKPGDRLIWVDVWPQERVADCLLRTLDLRATGLWQVGPRRVKLGATVRENGLQTGDTLLELALPVQDGWLSCGPDADSSKSGEWTKVRDVCILNDTEEPFLVFWIDSDGDCIQYGHTILPGEQWAECEHTYAGHVWLIWPEYNNPDSPQLTAAPGNLKTGGDLGNWPRARYAIGVFEFTRDGTSVCASHVALAYEARMDDSKPSELKAAWDPAKWAHRLQYEYLARAA